MRGYRGRKEGGGGEGGEGRREQSVEGKNVQKYKCVSPKLSHVGVMIVPVSHDC